MKFSEPSFRELCSPGPIQTLSQSLIRNAGQYQIPCLIFPTHPPPATCILLPSNVNISLNFCLCLCTIMAFIDVSSKVYAILYVFVLFQSYKVVSPKVTRIHYVATNFVHDEKWDNKTGGKSDQPMIVHLAYLTRDENWSVRKYIGWCIACNEAALKVCQSFQTILITSCLFIIGDGGGGGGISVTFHLG